MKVTHTTQPSSCSSLQLIFLFCELTHIHKRPCLYKGPFINDVIIFRGVSRPPHPSSSLLTFCPPPPGRDMRGYENPKTPILRLTWPAYVTQPGKRKVDFREHFWFLLTSNLNLSMAQPQRTVFWEDGIWKPKNTDFKKTPIFRNLSFSVLVRRLSGKLIVWVVIALNWFNSSRWSPKFSEKRTSVFLGW